MKIKLEAAKLIPKAKGRQRKSRNQHVSSPSYLKGNIKSPDL